MLHLKSVRGHEALVISGPNLDQPQPEIRRSGRKWVLGCGLNKVSRIPLGDISVQLESVDVRTAQGIRINLKAVAKVSKYHLKN